MDSLNLIHCLFLLLSLVLPISTGCVGRIHQSFPPDLQNPIDLSQNLGGNGQIHQWITRGELKSSYFSNPPHFWNWLIKNLCTVYSMYNLSPAATARYYHHSALCPLPWTSHTPAMGQRGGQWVCSVICWKIIFICSDHSGFWCAKEL